MTCRPSRVHRLQMLLTYTHMTRGIQPWRGQAQAHPPLNHQRRRASGPSSRTSCTYECFSHNDAFPCVSSFLCHVLTRIEPDGVPTLKACPTTKVKSHQTPVAFLRLGQAACIELDVILWCVTKQSKMCTAVVQTPSMINHREAHHRLHLAGAWQQPAPAASHTLAAAAGRPAPQGAPAPPARQSAGWGPCRAARKRV